MSMRSAQPVTDQQVLDELKKAGITSLDDLAKKIQEHSAAKAVYNKVRGVDPRDDIEYILTGHNYTLYHPDGNTPLDW